MHSSTQSRLRTEQKPYGPMRIQAGRLLSCNRLATSYDATDMPDNVSWEDAGFKKALKAYLDIKKNVDPKKELKKRAKNIGMRLIKIYKENGATPQEITAKVKSLGNHVKVRDRIKAKGQAKGLTHKQMIAAELRARRSATGVTSTGWFPAVQKLGGQPKGKKGQRAGFGSLIEKLSGLDMSETLVNSQPGAEIVAKKADSAVQQAMNKETADMVEYITKKQDQAARSNGL